MRARLDSKLRAALEAASEFIRPPATAASQVLTHAQRARRRRCAFAAAAASAVVLAATGLTYLAINQQHRPASGVRSSQPAGIKLPYGFQVAQIAAGGSYLYVESGSDDTLLAYDLATGRLVRQITVPDSPGGLAVGPGGLVWVNYLANQTGEPDGLWLLTSDLGLYSTLPNGRATLPVGQTTALMTSQYGLYRVSMPAPGAAGHGSEVQEPGTSLGPPLNTAPGPAALLDGRVVVGVSDGAGLHPRLVIAGQPNLTYSGGPFISTGRAVWVVTGGVAPGGYSGPLVRLDSELQPTTPAAVRRSALLSEAADVWSYGSTIWVSLGPRTWAAGPSLVCFTAGSPIGRVVTLPVRGSVLTLAATRGAVYVSAVPAGQYGSLGTAVTSYRVPAACR
jgi:hypothetical protein